MRVWHVYLVAGMQPVNGVVTVVGQLCEGLLAAGVEPRLFVLAAGPGAVPVPAGVAGAVDAHANLPAVDRRWRRLLAAGERPDVVHLHEVNRPPHRLLAARLTRLGVPWVTTTHSGLSPGSLARDRWKKVPYGLLVERRFLRRSRRVIALNPVEAGDVVAYLRGTAPPVTVIPNAAPPALLDEATWAPPPGRARPLVATLCRYDVVQKGLDRLAAIAAALPEADVAVFGMQDRNAPQLTERLRAGAPSNFSLRPPVFGAAKVELLRRLDLFVQPSRWEGLAAALIEALALGVPCAVSREVAATLDVGSRDLGLVLDDDPARAADQVRRALADAGRRRAWGRAGSAFVRRELTAAVVAERHAELYREVQAEAGRAPVEAGPGVTGVGACSR